MDPTPKNDPKDWTRKAILAALEAETKEAALARMRKMGLLDEHGNLTDRVANWGKDYVSYTLVESDEFVPK